MAAWTTDDLILRAKRKAQRPSTDLNFTDAEILQIADEEMYTFLVPLIRGARETYYLKSYTVAAVANQADYRIPADTSAGTIRYCELVDLSGRVSSIEMVPPESRALYLNGPSSVPMAVAFVADHIQMLPAPAAANFSLRIWYEQRRSLLVPTSECARIMSTGSSTEMFGQPYPYPDTWGPAEGPEITSLDIIEGRPNFDILSVSNPIVSMGFGIVLENPVDMPDPLTMIPETRPWMCPAGHTCVVPLPDLFHFALVGCVAATMLTESSDLDTAQALRNEVVSRIEGLSAAVEPRATAMAPVIFNPNSPTRRGMGWGR